MFKQLKSINTKPGVFSVYTADALWADAYRSKQMLAYHLNENVDVSSRKMEFIDRSASWMIDHFQLSPGKSVCDFGCGPGLYTSRLAKSGADVTGLDFSENSIEFARQQAARNGLKINYRHQNYLEVEPSDQFDLITLIMCDFCALSPAQRKTLLGIFHDGLKDDGALLLDVYSMEAFAAAEEKSIYEKNQLNHFWRADAYYCFVNTFKYEDEAVMLDKYSIFSESGEAEYVYNWLQYFRPESLEKELSEAGFNVTNIYKDVAGAPYVQDHTEFAVEATKRH